MKKILGFVAILLCLSLVACLNSEDNVQTQLEVWMQQNATYFNAKGEKGSGYDTLFPIWDKAQYIFVKNLNKDAKPLGSGVKPNLTSTVKMKYKGTMINGTAFDSSYLKTDSVAVFKINALAAGMQIALQYMSPNDSCEIAIPYYLAYGATANGIIPAYSTLIFNIKLVSIPALNKP